MQRRYYYSPLIREDKWGCLTAISDTHLQITLSPQNSFTQFPSCAVCDSISYHAEDKHKEVRFRFFRQEIIPKEKLPLFLQSGFLFSTSLSPAACLSSCCAQPEAERSLMEEVPLPSSVSRGGHRAFLPFLSYCTVLTTVRKKKKQAKKSQPTPDLTVGLEEGNKRILYIKKNLRHCSVFIVKEFVH